MELKNKDVLVTGGAGFIGSHLVDELIRQGASVTVVDNLSYGKRENIHEKAKLIECDVLHLEKIRGAVRGKDLVFHLAASATAKESSMGWKHPIYDYQVNAIGTLNIFRAITELNQRSKVIHASSAAVYGEPEYTPIDEKHPNNPISPYGISKLAGEKYCFAYFKEYGIPSVIARVFNAYGPRQARYVIKDFMEKLRLDPTRLEILGSGEQSRDFCYIGDVVTAFLMLIDAPSEVFNIATGKLTSIRKLAEIMVSEISPSAKIVSGRETWKGDIKNLGPADITKLRRLGFSPQISLNEGIRAFVNWHNQTHNLKRDS